MDQTRPQTTGDIDKGMAGPILTMVERNRLLNRRLYGTSVSDGSELSDAPDSDDSDYIPSPTATPAGQHQTEEEVNQARPTVSIDEDNPSSASSTPSSQIVVHLPLRSKNHIKPTTTTTTTPTATPSTTSTPSRRRTRVADIEAELNLTPAQSKQLRDLTRASMKAAGLLGTMTFHNNNNHNQNNNKLAADQQQQQQEALQHIIDTVKRDLPFLRGQSGGGVSEERIDALLRMRVVINNQNEKHNEWMVGKGKVKRRLGSVRIEDGDEEGGDESGQTAVSHGRFGKDRESTMLGLDDDAAVGVETQAVQVPEEDDRTPPSSPMSIVDGSSDPSNTILPHNTVPNDHQRQTLYPTSLIVRVTNTAIGAAIHTSQLIRSSSHLHQNQPSTIDDLSFDTFLTLVSEQVGFDVSGRVSAIVSRTMVAIAPNDVKVPVGNEGAWRAVLTAWQSARRRTGEFVVERVDEK